MTNNLKIYTISLILILSLFGCSTNNVDNSSIIHLLEIEDIPTLDISDATDPISFNSLGNVMEGLVMQGQTPGEVVMGVADSYTYDESTLTWTFHINPEANWVNNQGELQRKVTAQDFVYSWNRVLSGETFQYGFLLTDVAKIVSYEAIDDQTLSVTLSENVPYFLSILTFPTTYPLPYETIEASGAAYGSRADSLWYNGPYVMSEWTHGSQFVWTKNDNYWDADVVKTSAIVWRVIENYETATGIDLYDAGEIDLVQLSGEFVAERKDDADAILIPDTAVYYLMFNIANAGILDGSPIIDEKAGNDLFDNEKIRQAIAYQIDKTYITDYILKDGSVPAYSFIPSDYLSYEGIAFESYRNDGYMLTNKDLAQTLFEEGMQELGYEPGDNNLTIEIINYETSSAALIIEYVRQELNTLFADYGVTVTIKPLPLAEKLLIYQAGDFELTLSRWLPDYDWPTTYLDKWISTNAHNLAGYNNTEYDALLNTESKSTLDAFKDLQMAEKLVIEDAAIVPLYQAAGIYLSNPSLKNVYTYLSGVKASYKWAYKE